MGEIEEKRQRIMKLMDREINYKYEIELYETLKRLPTKDIQKTIELLTEELVIRISKKENI